MNSAMSEMPGPAVEVMERVLLDAEAAHVLDERLAERRRRRDRVPGHHRDSAEHGPDGGGGVTVDDDLAGGGVHPLDAPALLPRQVLLRVVQPLVDGGHVRGDGLGLPLELLADGGHDLVAVDPQQLGHDPDVDHVRQQLAQARVVAQLRGQLAERNLEHVHVAAHGLEVQRRVVDAEGAGRQRFHILPGGLRVHADHDVHFLLPPDPAVLVRADGEPGGQAGDVRGEHILPAHGDAHLKDRAHQDVVGRL